LPCFTKSFLTLLTAACLFPFVLSCSSFSSQRAIDSVSPDWLPKDGSTPSVAIMPFDNLASDEEMGTLVRKSFYNHFSSKNYRDIELSTVDRALESIQRTQSGTWREVPPETLGKYLHTDYVIYGKVKDYQKLYLGVYSQIVLTVEVEMVECRNGKGIWWKTETKRSHDGGIPIEIWSLMSATVRSGLHMQRGRLTSLKESAETWSLRFLSRLHPLGAPYPWTFRLPHSSNKTELPPRSRNAGASVLNRGSKRFKSPTAHGIGWCLGRTRNSRLQRETRSS
jgi:hypothetical protein